MKHEHAMCWANDIKQKRLLGGNPTQKKLDLLSFPLIFYFCHSLIFLFFYFNIEDNVVFKVWGYWENFCFLCCVKKNLCLICLKSHWFMRIWALCMRINWDRWTYKSNGWVCMQVLTFNWFRDWLWKYVMLTL